VNERLSKIVNDSSLYAYTAVTCWIESNRRNLFVSENRIESNRNIFFQNRNALFCCCLFCCCYKTCRLHPFCDHKKFRNHENISLQITR